MPPKRKTSTDDSEVSCLGDEIAIVFDKSLGATYEKK